MFAMGEEGALPSIFTKKTKKNDVMIVSLTVFTLIAILTLFYAQTFDKILNYTILLDSIGMAFSAGAIFYLRKTTAHLDKSTIYTMKFYPIMPIIFITAYLFVTFSIYIDDPIAARNGLGIFIGFVVIYFITNFFRKKKTVN